MAHAFYREQDYAPGKSKDNINTPNFRLDLPVAYVVFDDPLAAFKKPTLQLIVSWWLKNRYRAGEETHYATSCVVFEFKFEIDFWSSG